MIHDDWSLCQKIEELLHKADKIGCGPYWQPRPDAEGQGCAEKMLQEESISWRENGDDYQVKLVLSCSAENIFTHTEYYRNRCRSSRQVIQDSLTRMKILTCDLKWMEDACLTDIEEAYKKYKKKSEREDKNLDAEEGETAL